MHAKEHDINRENDVENQGNDRTSLSEIMWLRSKASRSQPNQQHTYTSVVRKKIPQMRVSFFQKSNIPKILHKNHYPKSKK